MTVSVFGCHSHVRGATRLGIAKVKRIASTCPNESRPKVLAICLATGGSWSCAPEVAGKINNVVKATRQATASRLERVMKVPFSVNCTDVVLVETLTWLPETEVGCWRRHCSVRAYKYPMLTLSASPP